MPRPNETILDPAIEVALLTEQRTALQRLVCKLQDEVCTTAARLQLQVDANAKIGSELAKTNRQADALRETVAMQAAHASTIKRAANELRETYKANRRQLDRETRLREDAIDEAKRAEAERREVRHELEEAEEVISRFAKQRDEAREATTRWRTAAEHVFSEATKANGQRDRLVETAVEYLRAVSHHTTSDDEMALYAERALRLAIQRAKERK